MSEKNTGTQLRLNESPQSWKSIVIYIAAILCAIDAPLQIITFKDTWGFITSLLLAAFLIVESYGRLRKRHTYLGPAFAPFLALLIIVLVGSTYVLHFSQ